MKIRPAEPSTRARHLRHLLLVAIGQEEIGRRVKQARAEAGLTQQELAERAGLKNGANVSRIERGKTNLTPKRMRRISDATKKPLEFFVRDSSQTANQDGASREGPQALQEIRETLVGLARAVEEVSTEVRELRREVSSSQRRVPANGEH